MEASWKYSRAPQVALLFEDLSWSCCMQKQDLFPSNGRHGQLGCVGQEPTLSGHVCSLHPSTQGFFNNFLDQVCIGVGVWAGKKQDEKVYTTTVEPSFFSGCEAWCTPFPNLWCITVHILLFSLGMVYTIPSCLLCDLGVGRQTERGGGPTVVVYAFCFLGRFLP